MPYLAEKKVRADQGRMKFTLKLRTEDNKWRSKFLFCRDANLYFLDIIVGG